MSKLKYKACLFDLDGVLVDTAKYHYLAWKRLADELNIPFSEEDNEKLKGVGRMDSLNIILDLSNKVLSEKEKIIYVAKKNEWYRSYILKMDESEILPGVIELLTTLRNMDMKIGLGSSSKNAPIILNVTGLEKYFDVISDGNSIKYSKPNPEVFMRGADVLGVKYKQCVVFEDAVSGIEAAKKAGMLSIGVGDKNILKDADYVVDNLIDFPLEIIKRL